MITGWTFAFLIWFCCTSIGIFLRCVYDTISYDGKGMIITHFTLTIPLLLIFILRLILESIKYF